MEIRYIPIWPVLRIAFGIACVLTVLMNMFLVTVSAVIFGGLASLMQEMTGETAFLTSPGSGLTSILLVGGLLAMAETVLLTLSAVVLAGLYNLLASLFGGIELKGPLLQTPTAPPILPVAGESVIASTPLPPPTPASTTGHAPLPPTEPAPPAVT